MRKHQKATSVDKTTNPHDPSAALSKSLDLFQYINHEAPDLAKAFNEKSLEEIRMLCRTGLREMVEMLYLTRRKKEAQLVLAKYIQSAPTIQKGHYTLPVHRLPAPDAKIKFTENLNNFLSRLDVRYMHDQREVDYPLNTKRMQSLSDKEQKGLNKYSFKHRLLFAGTTRELMLTYNGGVAFTLRAFELQPEEAIRIRDLLPTASQKALFSPTCLSIQVHRKRNAGTVGGVISTTGFYPVMAYYYSPSSKGSLYYSSEASDSIANALTEILGKELFDANPHGVAAAKLSIEDIIAVLLDISELCLLDSNTQKSTFTSQLRNITIKPKAACIQQHPSGSGIRSLVLPTFIAQEVMKYVEQHQYLYVTGRVPNTTKEIIAAAAATVTNAVSSSPPVPVAST